MEPVWEKNIHAVKSIKICTELPNFLLLLKVKYYKLSNSLYEIGSNVVEREDKAPSEIVNDEQKKNKLAWQIEQKICIRVL
mgnify:CR=1 FL=1